MEDLSKGIKKGGDSVSAEARFVEMGAEGAPVKDIDWKAQQIQTEGTRIEDPGTGHGVVVRNFFFKRPPSKAPRATKQEIFASFKNLIEMSLYGDGLVPMEDKSVHVYSKRELPKGMLRNKMIQEKADFVIMVLAKPRAGVALADTPQLI